MFSVHLFVICAHVNLVFSSSWCQGLAATSACGSSWTLPFLFYGDISCHKIKPHTQVYLSLHIYVALVIE